MSTTGAMSGGCLCGAVRFTATPEKPEMSVCHCGMCRRWTSSVFMGVGVGRSLALEGNPALGVYVSSDYGERVFCPTCGSSLFWRMRDGSHTEVAAQAFDDPSSLPLKKEVFIDAKPATYAFADKTKKLTGAELFAMMSGGSDGNG
jgi:hypothetical protein